MSPQSPLAETQQEQPAQEGATQEPQATDAAPPTEGDKQETQEQGEGGGAEEDENLIPVDFYYDYEEHVSKPTVTESSGLPSEMLTLLYPFQTVFLVSRQIWGFDLKERAQIAF